jgi:hypothetical protein
MADQGPAGAGAGAGAGLLTVIGMIYAAVNHKRVKAKCCGKTFEAELDIGSTEEATEAKEKEPKPKPVKKQTGNGGASAAVHPEPAAEAEETV